MSCSYCELCYKHVAPEHLSDHDVDLSVIPNITFLTTDELLIGPEQGRTKDPKWPTAPESRTDRYMSLEHAVYLFYRDDIHPERVTVFVYDGRELAAWFRTFSGQTAHLPDQRPLISVPDDIRRAVIARFPNAVRNDVQPPKSLLHVAPIDILRMIAARLPDNASKARFSQTSRDAFRAVYGNEDYPSLIDPNEDDHKAIRTLMKKYDDAKTGSTYWINPLDIQKQILGMVQLTRPSLDKSFMTNVLFKWACNRDMLDVVTVMMNTHNIDPRTAYPAVLQWAVWTDRFTLVHLLLRDGRMDPGEYNSAALRNAVAQGNEHLVRKFLWDDRVDPAAANNHALRLAVWKHNVGIARRLLETEKVDVSANNYQAVVDAKSYLTKNPDFAYAVELWDLIKERVDSNLDIDYDGMKAKFTNIQSVYSHYNSLGPGTQQAVQFVGDLVRNGRWSLKDLAGYITYKGDTNAMRIILRDGIYYPGLETKGETEFDIAVKHGHVDLVRLFLDDVRIIPRFPDTLLTEPDVEHVITMLLEDGRADPLAHVNRFLKEYIVKKDIILAERFFENEFVQNNMDIDILQNIVSNNSLFLSYRYHMDYEVAVELHEQMKQVVARRKGVH